METNKKKHSTNLDITGTCKKMLDILMLFPNYVNNLLEFCNLSFSTGKIPFILKTSRIVPVPKVNNASKENEFRPIGISPTLMTLLEQIYIRRLNSYVSKTNFMSKFQFGCRKGHSTEHAMIAVVDTIREKLDKGKICALVSLDLRNAFPSIHREKLLTKIKNKYKISDYWLRDYLSNRTQFVDIGRTVSNYRDMLIGLVQGSVLGPQFFTFFINDLPDVLDLSIVVPEMYVDDTNLIFFEELENLNMLKRKIESELLKVNEWVEMNSLALNSEKTKIMLIASKNKLSNVSDFFVNFNDVQIKTSTYIKCVGLSIDNTLSWDVHISTMVKRCYVNLNSLYKIQQFIPYESRVLVGQALVLSIVNYMSSIWSSTTANNLKIIENLIRNISRFVTCKRKYDSIKTEICIELKWLFPKELSEYNMMIIYFKLYKYRNIDFFTNYFRLNSEVHRYETSSANRVCLNIPNSNYGYNTFYYRATTMWNNLPTNLKQLDSLYQFKAKLKDFLLSRQKERLNVI